MTFKKLFFLCENYFLIGIIIILDMLVFLEQKWLQNLSAMVYHVTYLNFKKHAPQTGAIVQLWHWHIYSVHCSNYL